MTRISPTVSALALAGALACSSTEAAQRVFVASYGSDANTATNCVFTNPCRGFTAAMTVVDSGGEVVAIDAAGYGAVAITKSVTITANPGFYAGISASTGSAVTIATAGINVTLRGLNINWVGGVNGIGIDMTNGNRLSIENCVISNFVGPSGLGVRVNTAATVRILDSIIRESGGVGVDIEGGATAIISGTKILGNNNGVLVSTTAGTTTTAAISDSVFMNANVSLQVNANTGGATARVSVDRSTVSNSTYGLVAFQTNGTSVLTVSNSMVTGNATGLYQFGTATFESLGNNSVRQNGADTSGTITTVSGL
jgi:hypothetical protein